MNAKSNTRPRKNPPGFHTAEDLAFPMLAQLTKANEAARAKRLRNLRAVQHRQREIEAGRHQVGGSA